MEGVDGGRAVNMCNVVLWPTQALVGYLPLQSWARFRAAGPKKAKEEA